MKWCLIAPIDFWQNFTPFYGMVALCLMKIDSFRWWSSKMKLNKNDDNLKYEDVLKNEDHPKTSMAPKMKTDCIKTN